MEMAMIDQAELFHDCFQCVEDPRVAGRTTHPLNSILFLVVAAVIADADGPEEIECFGKEKLQWLSKFADFTNGIPSHDTIGRVLSLMKPQEFQEALITWHTCLREQAQDQEDESSDDTTKPVHLAIDGKTARGSYTDAEKSNALHFVSAWATKHGISLGQTQVDSKSNEITAIQDLLELVDVSQSTVTVDAIGAQKVIAEKIHEQGGEYVFAMKDNHPKLAEAIRAHFLDSHEVGLTQSEVRSRTTKCKGHGREEERFYAVAAIPDSMKSLTAAWPGAKAIGQAITESERKGKHHVEVRYYLMSRKFSVRDFASYVRDHWQIESMHWVLDVVFHEDASRIRTKNATANMSFVRRYVTGLLKRDTCKRSLKQKRKKAGWNTDFLQKLLFAA